MSLRCGPGTVSVQSIREARLCIPVVPLPPGTSQVMLVDPRKPQPGQVNMRVGPA